MRTANRGDWTYGRVEVRAKLPRGQGIWPASWMLPTDWVYGGWAASGEIDIMELVGHEPDRVHGTLHHGGEWPDNVFTGDSYNIDGADFSEDFHVFELEWEHGEIRWYVDGEWYQTQRSWSSDSGVYPAPFDRRFHLLLNVAVGGNWPGSPDGSTVVPQTMEIDWVRVYEDSPGEPAGGLQRPGDANQDGELDVSDAVRILKILFSDASGDLPCVGFSPLVGANQTLLDVNGDGTFDLSDAVSELQYLFVDGPWPALGTVCVPIRGCPDVCTSGSRCEPGSEGVELRIGDVPDCGSSVNLTGRVCGVAPDGYRVLVYIKVCDLWWGPKPTTSDPLTVIEEDGSWETDITTGGNDRWTDRAAVYVVPEGYVAPPVSGARTLPVAIHDAAVMATQVRRDCDCP